MNERWIKQVLEALKADDLLAVLGLEQLQSFVEYSSQQPERSIIRLQSPSQPIYYLWIVLAIIRSDPRDAMTLRVTEVALPDPEDPSTWEKSPTSIGEQQFFPAASALT
jgi:hypothetical protein